MGRPAKLSSWHSIYERPRVALTSGGAISEALSGRRAYSPVLPIPGTARPLALRGWLSTDTRNGRVFQRALEILPGLLTWLLVTAPLWGALLLPLPLAIAVLAFDLFWLYLSVTTAWRGWRGYQRLHQDEAVNWRARYDSAIRARPAAIAWEDVRHIVAVPTYKEPLSILRRTMESLAAQEVAAQLVVVLAMEAREEGGAAKSQVLEAEYGHRFAAMFATYHPAGVAGEVVGKSSNENYAIRAAKRRVVDQGGHPLGAITVTSCDADTIFHPRYYSCLTYKFCVEPDRYRRFWQSPILLTNNIWETPAPLRVGSALSGVHILANLMKKDLIVFPQSTYSLSLQLAHDAGYWDPDVIPEDWHMFLKCFYASSGAVSVQPIFLPTGNDAVHAGGWWSSIKMTYIQHKRHAWGASDVPYAIRQSLAHAEMGVGTRLRRLVALISNHLLWATHWFLLSVGWAVPLLLARVTGTPTHPELFLCAKVTLYACYIPYLVMIWIDAKLRPPKPDNWTLDKNMLATLMWFMLPVTSFFTSTIPALDAQTRLMLGKRLEYRVTEKK